MVPNGKYNRGNDTSNWSKNMQQVLYKYRITDCREMINLKEIFFLGRYMYAVSILKKRILSRVSYFGNSLLGNRGEMTSLAQMCY